MFTKKLLLDMDTGVDDALAIAYAVGCGAEIAGITCGFGNVETAALGQAVDDGLGERHRLAGCSTRVHVQVLAERGGPIDALRHESSFFKEVRWDKGYHVARSLEGRFRRTVRVSRSRDKV